MFDLNFIAEPGIQAESIEDSWSSLPKKTETETNGNQKSTVVFPKKSRVIWEYIGAAIFAIIIFSAIWINVNTKPAVGQDMVLNQIFGLIIENGNMEGLQFTEAHFRSDFVKVTITSSEMDSLQNFIQGYRKEDNIPYEIFQKNKLNYMSLDFPWEGDKKGGDIETLKTLADKIVFSNNISISIRNDEFELQGSYSDIISYLLQMADNDLIQKFTLSVLHLESDRYYLNISVNKT